MTEEHLEEAEKMSRLITQLRTELSAEKTTRSDVAIMCDRLRQKLYDAHAERDSLKVDLAEVRQILDGRDKDLQQCWKQQKELCKERDSLRAEVEMLRLRWQTGPIPEDGYYFYKKKPSHDADITYYLEGDNFENWMWAGPIPEPEEK